MAGFIIYSIDWTGFSEFQQQPSPEQLQQFAAFLDDAYEEHMDDVEDGDIAKTWSNEAENYQANIAERLKQPHWYDGLSIEAQTIWENAIYRMASNESNFDFRVDSDGVYWDVIEMCLEYAGKTKARSAIGRFGQCPFSLSSAESIKPASWDEPAWHPIHSMHTPDEVKQMIEECNTALPVVELSGNEEAYRDLCDELLPALDAVAKDNRMLFVSVDT